MKVHQRRPQIKPRKLRPSKRIGQIVLTPRRAKLAGVARVVENELLLRLAVAEDVDVVDVGVGQIVHRVVGLGEFVVRGLSVVFYVDVGVVARLAGKTRGVEGRDRSEELRGCVGPEEGGKEQVVERN